MVGSKYYLKKKGKKGKKLYKNIPKYTTYCSLNMGHTTEKKKCPFDDYFTSLPSITLFQQKRATDKKFCPSALYKDLSTYLPR